MWRIGDVETSRRELAALAMLALASGEAKARIATDFDAEDMTLPSID